MIESKNFIIKYDLYEDYLNNLINDLEKNISRIFDFFKIDKLDNKINIEIISTKNKFDEVFFDIHKFKPDLNSIGFYHNNRIIYLSYSDFKNTNHINDTYEDYINVLIHECTHYVHSQYTNDKMSLRCINEGLALFIGHQYTKIDYNKFNCKLDSLLNQENIDYYNYYLLFNFIYENYDREILFKFISDKQYTINNIEKVYNDIVNKYNINTTITMNKIS